MCVYIAMNNSVSNLSGCIIAQWWIKGAKHSGEEGHNGVPLAQIAKVGEALAAKFVCVDPWWSMLLNANMSCVSAR